MTSPWISVLAMLLAYVAGSTAAMELPSCAELHTPTTVVVLGSAVTASCLIKDDCPLTTGQDFHVEWHLNNVLVPSLLSTNQSSRTFGVFIPSFMNTSGVLSCLVCLDSECQTVGGVKIRGGYPPPVPKNLSCRANLTNPITLLCKWDPGLETHLPTQYNLTVTLTESDDKRFDHVPPAGVHFYRIPRSNFSLYSKVKIFVRANNPLGQATSEPLVLDPMESAKLDPPEIQTVEAKLNRFGCLKHMWSLSKDQMWIVGNFNIEVRLKPVNSKLLDGEKNVMKIVKRGKPVEVCDLLHGTEYQSKIRVRYRQGPWSEWSNHRMAATPEKVPTGRLNSWLKILEEQSHTRSIQLFWKPSNQFRANGVNVSYIVSLRKPPSSKRLCDTRESYCVFQLPKAATRVYLTAVNSAGKSSATDVLVYKSRDLDPVSGVNVLPQGDQALLVQWKSPVSLTNNVTVYVLEWWPKREPEVAPSSISFDLVDRNQSSFLVSVGIEPYKRYEISVYPVYRKGIGYPKKVLAYTRQKAPSVPPDLKFGKIRHSHAEISWDEIPLDKRNGIIQSYKVFYWDEQGNTKDVEVKVTDERETERRVILRNLNPFSVYKAFIMVSTDGGSLNGPNITLKIESLDILDIVLIVIPACVGITLFVIIIMFACFTKHERLKICFWPVIPDPANSSIRKWTSTDSLQDVPSLWEVQDPVLVYLSHFSLLNLSEKGLEKGDSHVKDDPWLCDGGSDDDRDSSGSSHRPVSSDSGQHSDSVPYATVVFAGPYRSQPPPPIYLRSESTQPLLGAEEPLSPQPYENMFIQMMPSEQGLFSQCQEGALAEGERGSLCNFPLLRSLAVKDVQSET